MIEKCIRDPPQKIPDVSLTHFKNHHKKGEEVLQSVMMTSQKLNEEIKIQAGCWSFHFWTAGTCQDLQWKVGILAFVWVSFNIKELSHTAPQGHHQRCQHTVPAGQRLLQCHKTCSGGGLSGTIHVNTRTGFPPQHCTVAGGCYSFDLSIIVWQISEHAVSSYFLIRKYFSLVPANPS